MEANVFSDDDGCMFSDGVDRDFGTNKMVFLTTGKMIQSAVQPLKCNPVECGLKLVGTIQVEFVAPDNCMDCPKSTIISDPDLDDWFCDDDCAVACKATPNNEQKLYSKYRADRSEYKLVTVSCRPYNCRKEANRPEWCPGNV